MNKPTYTVEQLNRRYEFVRKLRRGVMITFLFTALTVGAGAAPAERYNSSLEVETHQVVTMAPAVSGSDYAEARTFQILASKNYTEQGKVDYQQSIRYDAMMKSYHEHKGDYANGAMQKKFGEMAMPMSKLPYEEMLSRYSVNNDVNMMVMTFPNSLELNVTQADGAEEVAFSLYHGEVMLYMGSELPSVLADKLLPIINQSLSVADGLS